MFASVNRSDASILQFQAAVKEHKTIFQLRQQLEFRLIAIHNPIDEITVSFEERPDGGAILLISPRRLDLTYQLVDRRSRSERRPITAQKNGSLYPLRAVEEHEDRSVYQLSETELQLVSENLTQAVFDIQPLKKQEFQFGFLTLAPDTSRLDAPVKLAIRYAAATATPPGTKLSSQLYSYSFTSPDGTSASIPLELKIQYTGTDTDSRSVYSYDVSSGGWKAMRSYHNVEERFVQTRLTQTNAAIGIVTTSASNDGIASWYRYRGCLCAASRAYPKGTRLKITRLKTNKSIIVRVNDYGPEEWTGRIIDLDATAFSTIGSLRAGLIYVSVEPVQL